MKFSLNSLIDYAKRFKYRKPDIKPIRTQAGHEKSYLSILYRVVRQSKETGHESLSDAAYDLKIRGITNEGKEGFTRVLGSIFKSHKKRWIAAVKRGTGVDISSFMRKKDGNELMITTIDYNSRLINSLSKQTADKVRSSLFLAKKYKWTKARLAEELAKGTNLSRNRAQLIADDQINKINADFNRMRQEQAGIKGYIWKGRLDKRERPLHTGLEGNKYKWDEPTGAEGGQKPAEPIRCRCVAKPDLEA